MKALKIIYTDLQGQKKSRKATFKSEPSEREIRDAKSMLKESIRKTFYEWISYDEDKNVKMLFSGYFQEESKARKESKDAEEKFDTFFMNTEYKLIEL